MKKQSILVLIVVLPPFFIQTTAADFTSFPICTATGLQHDPAVSGNTVVWHDRRDFDLDIYGKDFSTGNEFPIGQLGEEKQFVDISGNTVVYRKTASDDIYVYDLSTQQESLIITDAGIPSISGDVVVWGDLGDIYGKNLSTGDMYTICTAPGSQSYPVIDGDIVIWRDTRNGGDNFSLYGYDLSTSTEFPICLGTADDRFDISGNIVVWQDVRNDPKESSEPFTNLDIYGLDLTSGQEFAICLESGDQCMPSISEDTVVWTDGRNGGWANYDIYGYDLLSGTEFGICTILGAQQEADISGNLVVWNSGGDIYGSVVPVPSAMLLGTIGLSFAGWLCRRSRKHDKEEK